MVNTVFLNAPSIVPPTTCVRVTFTSLVLVISTE